MSLDYAIHSDFLIHWTGKDLEPKGDWDATGKPAMSEELGQAYLDRLHSILKYGLWLTQEPDKTFLVGGKQITIPSTPKICFTELKLSESRTHAKNYGRLGIGVKRPYVFSRLGRPLAYFGYDEEIHDDPFLTACVNDFKDKTLLNFFKPMSRNSPTDYQFYSESEWRILFFEKLLGKELIDPRDERYVSEHEFFDSLTPDGREKLRYLAPLDGWLAMIIYPTIDVKNSARVSAVSAEIDRIKKKPDHGNDVEGGLWPIEIDLNACRHF